MHQPPAPDPKADLLSHLQGAREAVVWKLDGLGEVDVRRPLTPAGTNLLGLVKHLTGVELLYFGFVLGREVEDAPEWLAEDAELFVDRWARPDETREGLVADYRRAWRHADAVTASLDLDAPGFAPWLPQPRMTLHQVLVHVLAETTRHAGHADVVRELVDGSVGQFEGDDRLDNTGQGRAPSDAPGWRAYRDRVEAAARAVAP
ncbi:DinB family protein [Solicola sp. PLA-1-18]|uniref:DinB family protein n=1 Tax=Solicola sp. PLA-1-18 TaxID=3380532 RepID=UPI003B781769